MNYLRRTSAVFVALLVSTILTNTVAASPPGQPPSPPGGPIITDCPAPSGQPVAPLSDVGYIYTELVHSSFLRSDGSAVRYISGTLRNVGATPISSHSWCFYWGQNVYSSIFAEDNSGYLEVTYGEQYSDTYGTYGMCVDISFRHPVESGEEYWFAIGITIDDHHSVAGDTIHAQWTVHSASSVMVYTSRASWPYNHQGFLATPTPDEMGDSFARWTRTSDDAPWEFSVDITVTLGSQMAVAPLSQGIRPYDGADLDTPWEGDAYGVNTGKTIGDWGCYLTSGTMAMNYFAEVMGVAKGGALIDPGDLNEWLRTPASSGSSIPRGYSDGGKPGFYSLVRSDQFDEASTALFDTNGAVVMAATNVESVQGIGDLANDVRDGRLGILNVELRVGTGRYGHFVLVTGFTTENGVDTAVINDPYEQTGTTTLLAEYANEILRDDKGNGNVRWLDRGDTAVRANYVTLYANCPVELLVTDHLGRRAGFDPRTGTMFEEIPDSAYVTQYAPGALISSSEGTKILQIETMDPSEYQVEVIGTGSGSYTVDYEVVFATGEADRGRREGTTSAGEVDVIDLVYDPSEGFVWPATFLPLVWR